MRIIFFSSDDNGGSGAFRCLVKIAQYMKNQGHMVTVVLPYHGSGMKLLDRALINRKVIFSMARVGFTKSRLLTRLVCAIFALPNAIAKAIVKSYLKKEKPDIVVMNSSWTGIGADAAKKLSIPIVWHIREFLEEDQNRKFIFKKRSIDLIDKSYKIITVSKSIYAKYLPYFGSSKMVNIYDGVDVEKFYVPKKTIFKTKCVHLLCVGRVTPRKGQEILLKALNNIYEYHFDLVIIGRCYPRYLRKLKKMIPNIKERVHFLGQQIDIAKYYEEADVFVMNSLSEAFGLVTVEAMLSGCLVLGAESMGTMEIIDNEDNGVFYKPGDSDDLREKLRSIFNDPEKYKNIAAAGRRHCYENFSFTANIAKIAAVYEEALKSKK
jgi:glycosyltransferase involved in cell wall biosynthesis